MNASGIISTNASSASLADLGSARARIELTDSSEVYDVPKSPRTAWLAQSRYCVTAGRSRPRSVVERVDRVLRGEAAEHVAPDVARQHLAEREHDHAQQPERDERERETAGEELQHRGGDSLTEAWSPTDREEAPTAAAQGAAAVGPFIVRSLRRATSCSGTLAELVDEVALDLRAARVQRVVEVGEDHRRLVEQQQLDLLRVLPLIGERDGARRTT